MMVTENAVLHGPDSPPQNDIRRNKDKDTLKSALLDPEIKKKTNIDISKENKEASVLVKPLSDQDNFTIQNISLVAKSSTPALTQIVDTSITNKSITISPIVKNSIYDQEKNKDISVGNYNINGNINCNDNGNNNGNYNLNDGISDRQQAAQQQSAEAVMKECILKSR